MTADLRTYLDRVRTELPREIVDVRQRVSAKHETTAILSRLEEGYRSPVLVFHDVEDASWPVVTNVCGSMTRLALALGCRTSELPDRYATACRNPIAPRLVEDAPAQAVVRRGADVDLSCLPPLVYHEHDADRPWVTAAIVAARDPDSARFNLSFHRLMITGRNTSGIYIAAGKHLDLIRAKYARDGRDMPIAAFIGAHPLWAVGAAHTGALDVDEYEIIGGLLGEPLDVVATVTQPDLVVPARAELVLEGVVPIDETVEEGPFGEFTGYATGTDQAPVFRVDAMTMRRDPVYQDIVSGHREHAILPLLGIETHLLEVARAVSPDVRAVKVPAPLTAYVSLRKTSDDVPARLIDALLEADVYTKHVIVVDESVNLNDHREVLTAVALHVQADRDVVVRTNQRGTPLDPSCLANDGRTAKMGIDATQPLRSPRSIVPNAVPRATAESVDIDALLEQGTVLS